MQSPLTDEATKLQGYTTQLTSVPVIRSDDPNPREQTIIQTLIQSVPHDKLRVESNNSMLLAEGVCQFIENLRYLLRQYIHDL